MKLKQVDNTLAYFGSPLLGYRIKINCAKLETVNPEVFSILIF